jgi:hypothetical protein
MAELLMQEQMTKVVSILTALCVASSETPASVLVTALDPANGRCGPVSEVHVTEWQSIAERSFGVVKNQ